MGNRLWLAGLTLLLTMPACSLSTPLPAPPTTDAATALSATPRPTSLPIVPAYIPTSTRRPVSAAPKEALVNCRFGPGTVYIVMGQLQQGQSAQVSGQNQARTWFYIKDPGNPDGSCWVAADVVEVTGDTEDLPIIPPPNPSVTGIVLTVEPGLTTVPCDAFPVAVYFSAEVTTDAPAVVTYRWEVSTGVSSVDNAIAFEEAGTQIIRDYYQIAGPNDYWIRFHVLGPNIMSEETNFRVNCNPERP